jgi:hypothetical protein
MSESIWEPHELSPAEKLHIRLRRLGVRQHNLVKAARRYDPTNKQINLPALNSKLRERVPLYLHEERLFHEILDQIEERARA